MNTDVIKQFNQIATEYDIQRPQLVPGFYDYYSASLAVLNYEGIRPRILDLGCGTGLLSAFILEKFPEADLTLIDIASEMVDVAKERFKLRTFPTRFIIDDYATHHFETKFDIIVSGLSIHHLSPIQKEKLFKKCYGLLSDEGEFLNIDQVLSPTKELEERYTMLWRNKIKNSTLSMNEVEKAIERTQLDQPTSVQDHFIWLNNAGFQTIDVVYKYWYFCSIYSAK